LFGEEMQKKLYFYPQYPRAITKNNFEDKFASKFSDLPPPPLKVKKS
jgi:hypothetical protein